MAVAQICGTPFWNSSTSWESNDPYITQCFQHLMLVCGSCGVLWIVAPFEFYNIYKSRGRPAPWTTLSISKVIFKIILLSICIIELAKEIYLYMKNSKNGLDGLIAATIYFITIILTIILTMMCKKKGLKVSLALPSFWMLSTVATIFCIYSDIIDLNKEEWTSIVTLVDNSIEFTVSIVSLILSSIADTYQPADSTDGYQNISCPLESSSLFSRLTFTWISRLLSESSENSLHQDYLSPLCSELRSSSVTKTFSDACSNGTRKEQHLFPSTEYFHHETDSPHGTLIQHRSPKKVFLLKILLTISTKFLGIAAFLEVVYIAIYFVPVYILSLILDFDVKDHQWHIYVFAASLFLSLLFLSIADSQRKYYCLMAALRIKTAVITAVFEKSLKLPQGSKYIKHLISVHAENVFQFVSILSDIWGAPIRLLLGVYVLWRLLGISAFVGLSTAILLIPIYTLIETCAIHFQKKAHGTKLTRLNVLSESLYGMKVLKFNAWEEFFLAKLKSLRKHEIYDMKKAEFLRMGFKFLFLSSTSLVMLATITTYLLIGNSIDSKTVFVSLLLMCMLRKPFRSALHLLSSFIEGMKSVSKIQSFLERKELDDISTQINTEGNCVVLQNASFSYEDSNVPVLKNLNISIAEGSLVAVVGGRQSGKTSLIRAILGELNKIAGEARIQGQIALVAEESWIQSMTVGKNVLFLNSKDEAFYQKTLKACDLLTDIENLPAGEETEIGLKGVHLTQTQRLKLDIARAVYQNADIYLLDDPLKSLESSLAEQLFQRVIGRSGTLKDKTRLFVTTSDDFLPLVDYIIFLKDGRILEHGSYSTLLGKKGHFSEYIQNCESCKFAKKKQCSLVEDLCFGDINTFGKQSDLWFSNDAVPAKIELENVITNETSNYQKGFFYKIGDYLRTIGFAFSLLSLLLAVLACGTEVASGVWLSVWVDRTKEGQIIHNWIYNLIIYILFILSQVLCTVLCGISIYATSNAAAERLHAWILERTMRAFQPAMETTPVPKILQRFDIDFEYVDERIPTTFYIWLVTVLKAIALMMLVYVVSPFLAIVSIPLIFAFLVVQKLYLNSWKQLQHLTAATSCPLMNLLEDTLQGVSHVRATRSSSHFINRLHLKLDTHNNCFFLFLMISRWLNSSIDIITAFLVLITIAMGFTNNEVRSGYMGLAIVSAIQIAEILTAEIFMTSMLNFDLTAFERIRTFSSIKQESEWEDPSNRPDPSWPSSGDILIRNLSTTYEEGMYPVLHNINLSIRHGEKVAIVGKEDSGIYTLLYSLLRLIEPSNGQIFINGNDIGKLGLKDLRSRLAVIPQETLIFHGTLRQNLCPFETFGDHELFFALEKVGLKDKFSNLDENVPNIISHEEQYLLSVARCILKKPKILIIDKPKTSESTNFEIFQDSTILSFCEQPASDFEGRIIRMLSGEIVNDDIAIPDKKSI